MGDTKQKFDLKKLLQTDISTLFKKGETKSPTKSKKVKKVEHKKDLIVFDIGAKSINLILGKQNKDKTLVTKCVTIPTTVDTMLDGKVVNPAALVNAIQLTLNEHDIKTKDVVITTNSSQIINREMVINKVDEDEMETVLRYEMQQYLPINLNDYIVRYTILDEFEEHEQEKLKVYVISYPDRMAKAYYNLLKSMDLKPFALETSYVSLNKLINQTTCINATPFDFTQTTAFLDMGSATIDVNIYKNKKIDLTRIIKTGGDNIDMMLSQRHNIPMQSALAIKSKLDLSQTDEPSPELESVKLAVDNICFEIDRIFQFYKNKSYSNIDKVYIYGGVSKLTGLDEYMSEKLGVSVETVTHMDSIQFKNDETEQQICAYLNAIGAMIRL
ncbi:MAG: type IV pilus assembly protein PilM [Turicibacter sp.]